MVYVSFSGLSLAGDGESKFYVKGFGGGASRRCNLAGWLKEQTKSENPILYICDFRRGVLNVRLSARIQHLLPDHNIEYRISDFCFLATQAN